MPDCIKGGTSIFSTKCNVYICMKGDLFFKTQRNILHESFDMRIHLSTIKSDLKKIIQDEKNPV